MEPLHGPFLVKFDLIIAQLGYCVAKLSVEGIGLRIEFNHRQPDPDGLPLQDVAEAVLGVGDVLQDMLELLFRAAAVVIKLLLHVLDLLSANISQTLEMLLHAAAHVVGKLILQVLDPRSILISQIFELAGQVLLERRVPYSISLMVFAILSLGLLDILHLAF